VVGDSQRSGGRREMPLCENRHVGTLPPFLRFSLGSTFKNRSGSPPWWGAGFLESPPRLAIGCGEPAWWAGKLYGNGGTWGEGGRRVTGATRIFCVSGNACLLYGLE